ncbi:MAG: glutamine synthetase type III, partial [Clostridia bacterium]|nr:glutamine synthetase type III [Clostridia bacterium]
AIENDAPYVGVKKTQMKLGVDVLPKFNRDTTDRNRTSPFAFTGNKFEFRMVGSSDSIAGANIALNAAVADELSSIADELEGTDGSFDAVSGILRERLGKHFRIIFNGDGYGEEWIEEAEQRGLLNLPTTADAVVRMLDSKNVSLFLRTGVYSEAEAESRCEIMLDNYAKKVAIEANTMVDMINHDILPSAVKYSKVLSDGAAAKKAISPRLSICMEEKLLDRLADLTDELYECSNILEESTAALRRTDNAIEAAELCRDRVLSDMHRARVAADGIEKIVGREFWCYPTYGDLMHDVR